MGPQQSSGMSLPGNNIGYHSGRQSRLEFLSKKSSLFFLTLHYSYESDRINNSGSARNYRDTGYPSQHSDNYNNQQLRRMNNYPASNGNRGRRGTGAKAYRDGTQSDAITGGKLSFKREFCFLLIKTTSLINE